MLIHVHIGVKQSRFGRLGPSEQRAVTGRKARVAEASASTTAVTAGGSASPAEVLEAIAEPTKLKTKRTNEAISSKQAKMTHKAKCFVAF